MNKDRINPFASSANGGGGRERFPPLDDFFAVKETVEDDGQSRRERDSFRTPNESPAISASDSMANFSLELSIDGKAALAQDQFRVSKYGLDCLSRSQDETQSDDAKRSNINSSTPTKQQQSEWERIMLENTMNVSLCSMRTKSDGRTSPGRCSISGSFLFDSDVMESLATPQRIRAKQTSSSDKTSGVTKLRGQYQEEDSPASDESPSKLETLRSGTAEDFQHMFETALRFNEDFDESKSQSDISPITKHSSSGGGKDKSSSISFDSGVGLEKLDRVASPIHKQIKDSSFSCMDSNVSFIGSNSSPQFSVSDDEKSVTSIPPSPLAGTQSESQCSPPRPIVRTTSVPFDESEKKATTFVPFDESFANEPGYEAMTSMGGGDEAMTNDPLALVTSNSVELISTKDQYTNLTAVTTEESHDAQLISLSTSGIGPRGLGRSFGTNLAFRLNSQAAHDGDESTDLEDEANRRGVRLNRLSKLKELGLSPSIYRARENLCDF
ncbi:hypothetical protein THAOC_06231 [Thalassiosira oceanica]|uniref:Uncharacterized protein n=1 Tax=Thalassiosira oceanica TaxID=159749 RepID=K0TFC3_THAOC|nr:hypothetical protein THAOC_06231 [Thalassiosira oceanica]|eukprot:EJK72251.1 hypothetical protein THAOC_06231 [Thalassiosira oceanica]